MNRELLWRFFDGMTTTEEEELIQKWVEQSVDNQKKLVQERLVFDMTLMNSAETSDSPKVKSIYSFWIRGAVASVFLLLAGTVVYFLTPNLELSSYNTVLVPPGQRVKLVLADSTTVWLNANSTFRYPRHYWDKSRTVHLDGEAYFEVSADKKKPFIVKTTKGDVLVTGTKFNVQAYSHKAEFETSLFEGGVDIYDGNLKVATLQPEEKAILKNGRFVVLDIDDNGAYLWTEGLMAFKDKSLEEIVLSLEKVFSVHFEIQGKKLSEKTFTGKFRQSDGLEYALKILQENINFSYERDELSGVVFIKE